MSKMITCINDEGKLQDFPEHTVKDKALMDRIGFKVRPTPEQVPEDVKGIFEPLVTEPKEEPIIETPVVEETVLEPTPEQVPEEPVAETHAQDAVTTEGPADEEQTKEVKKAKSNKK